MSLTSDTDLAIRLELLRARQALRASGQDPAANAGARSDIAGDPSPGLTQAAGGEAVTEVDGCERGELEIRLAESASALRELQDSVRFRIGTLVADAARSPLGLFRLPWQLLKLSMDKRGAEPGPLVPENSQGAGAERAHVDSVSLDFVTPPRSKPIAPEPVASELFALPGASVAPLEIRDLRVAAVMDPFSLASFGPDCQLFPLHPESWPVQIQASRPHLLLVESAWLGEHGEWTGLVQRASPEIRALVASCRHAGIPTVFWNKEDPLHFDAFLETARLFDHVFTTDASSIPRYRRLLGHDRVGLLPFALQPRMHNPIQQGVREASSVFAGAWYGRMQDRCRDFEAVADALMLAGPLVIHDRHDGLGAAHQRFPQPYAAKVRSSVAYEDTAALYRSHRIGVNLNTIKQSPTMFARRALELIGCNTSVYGNHALGLRQLFGDLTVASDSSEYLLARAWSELRDPDAPEFRQRRLRALRKVLREHTWARRLQRVASAALGDTAPAMPGNVLWVLARVQDLEALAHVEAAVVAQQGVQVNLLLDMAEGLALPPNARRMGEAEPAASDWVAVFHPEDHYGKHYLEDLVLGASFALGDAIGKGAWLQCGQDGNVVLQQAEREYRLVDVLALRSCLFRRSLWRDSLPALLDGAESGCLQGEALVSLDAMHYLRKGAGRGLPDWEGVALDEGAALAEIEQVISRWLPAPDASQPESDALTGAQLAHLLNCGVVPQRTSASAKGATLEVCSLLEDGEEDAMFSAIMPRELIEREGEVQVCLQAPPASQLHLYLDPVDGTGEALTRLNLLRGAPTRMKPSPDTAGYRLAVSLRGQFVRPVDALWLGAAAPATPVLLAGGQRLLVLCNGYPKADSLYRNTFVHQRVLEYKRQGVCVDVVSVNAERNPGSYEFEGVLVQECSPATLAATLSASRYEAIAVHFLDASLWAAMRAAVGQARIVVWLHGSDIQPWTRRRFNYVTAEECEQARLASDERMAFWRGLLTSQEGERIHLVFVSRTFAEETWEDLGFRLPDERWSVIPNPINTDLFAYVPKPVESRFRILSIRPHHSRIYANDLVAAVIHRLADHPAFPKMQFTLVGDGPLWEENFSSLRQYANVELVRRFLPQREIAAMHARHGVFLVPTRGDTQGVSRDEAMSSGLVPVTCNAGAVAEFVDPSCGFLCEQDNVDELANALLSLSDDPDGYRELSGNAREKVEEASSFHSVVRKEISLLNAVIFDGQRIGL